MLDGIVSIQRSLPIEEVEIIYVLLLHDIRQNRPESVPDLTEVI